MDVAKIAAQQLIENNGGNPAQDRVEPCQPAASRTWTRHRIRTFDFNHHRKRRGDAGGQGGWFGSGGFHDGTEVPRL